MSGRLLWTLGALCWLSACGSSGDAGPCKPPSGAFAGAQDMHCGAAVTVNPASCHPADAGVADAGTADAGGSDAGGHMHEYGETMFNASGDDDDCKYHLAWSVTPMCQNGGVTFTLTLTHKADNSPVTGADPQAEVFLTTTHPAPNTKVITTEGPAGTYKIGPIRFDQSGQWTVRFHLFEDCSDSVDSPHGHAAFFVNVP